LLRQVLEQSKQNAEQSGFTISQCTCQIHVERLKQVLAEREFGDALTSQSLAGVVLPVSDIQKARVGTVNGSSANECDPWDE
jgi:hypothetical protein